MIKTNLRFIFLAFIIILSSCQKQEPSLPQNKVPIANAGPSNTVMLPANSFTLVGSGTDADGNIVAYLWSQVSGPSGAYIVNPGSASTEVKNFIAGSYVFQLMVTDDKGATGVDTTSLIVKPNPIQTLTSQPSNSPYEYQVTNINGRDATGPGPEISIATWTTSGEPYTLRNVFKFDLSTIPANATITSAHLYLYSNPKPLTGNFVDANFGTANTLLLQQVTSDWSAATLGWYKQPLTNTANQIVIPSTTLSVQDLNLDVTSMVQSMISNNSNYGFLLKLQNEVIYNSRIFISSHNTVYPEKHPKLVVVYQ